MAPGTKGLPCEVAALPSDLALGLNGREEYSALLPGSLAAQTQIASLKARILIASPRNPRSQVSVRIELRGACGRGGVGGELRLKPPGYLCAEVFQHGEDSQTPLGLCKNRYSCQLAHFFGSQWWLRGVTRGLGS